MAFRIQKVAVLGSGVMGSGIACHMANIGLQVLMLDILPKDLDQKSKDDPAKRNSIANKSLANALQSKPAPLYDKNFSSRIKTGNFEDDLEKIFDCDWIIEVVIEKMEIKRSLFDKVENYRKPGTLITSNTSGIPIAMLAEGRSDDFRKHFCGTHFFNPARYMRLLEIIPHEDTSKAVIDFFMDYGDRYLGKQTVLCKDTPAFIANRIGFFAGNKVLELTEKHKLPISTVDQLTGAPIGWPSTGSFRLQDLVGLDTSVKVTRGVIENCPEDEYVKVVKERGTPRYLEFLLENHFLGNKSGQGYYKKTSERDEKGRSVILALDLEKLEYVPIEKIQLKTIEIAKKTSKMDKRLKDMMATDDVGGHFIRDFMIGLLSYSSNRIPEIADNIFSIDEAMKAGYAWEFGPFEYWDMIGVKEGIQMAEAQGEKMASWVKDMINSGNECFYKIEDGKKWCYNPKSGQYEIIKGVEGLIVLDNLRDQAPVFKNSECTIHDIGDGVMCLEFHTKSNAIGEGIGEGLMEAVRIAEEEGWKGLVIGNNAKNFTVGANLMGVGMFAMQKDFNTLERMVHGFQQVNMRLRYSKIPVVVATQGYVFGGGCEILMHCDASACAAESYIGLVEVGVGLIPGGGGTKEYALRASDQFFEGDVKIPILVEKLRAIATASVATSAWEGYRLGSLIEGRDHVVVNTSRAILEAKKLVLQLSENYTQPLPKEVTVLGRSGLATLYTAINEFYLGSYMSEYDVEIARKVAYVLCGGDLTGEQKVSEQYLLDLEKEAFLQLLGNQKTLDRIQYMLMNNKPLRN